MARVVPFPLRAPRPSRRKSANALRSCLQYLAREAELSTLPLTAEMIGLAVLSLDEELAGSDELAGSE